MASLKPRRLRPGLYNLSAASGARTRESRHAMKTGSGEAIGVLFS